MSQTFLLSFKFPDYFPKNLISSITHLLQIRLRFYVFSESVSKLKNKLKLKKTSNSINSKKLFSYQLIKDISIVKTLQTVARLKLIIPMALHQSK